MEEQRKKVRKRESVTHIETDRRKLKKREKGENGRVREGEK